MSTKNILYLILILLLIIDAYFGVIFLKNQLGLERFADDTPTITNNNKPKLSNKTLNNLPTINNQTQESPITILAFGDMMLDRYIRNVINNNSPEYPFEK